MKQFILFIIVFIIPFFACKDSIDMIYNPHQEVCGIKNPVENLNWLKNKIKQDEDKKGWIIQRIYTLPYKGEDLILIHHPASSLAFIDEVYDCQGNKIDIEILSDLIELKREWVCIYDVAKQ